MGLADSADRDRDRSRGGADLNADSVSLKPPRVGDSNRNSV